MTTSLQICSGESAMGSLIQAGYAPVMSFSQGFDGPLQDFKTYEEYERAFQKFLYEICEENSEYRILFPVPLFSYRHGPDRSLPISSSEFVKIINEHDEVVIWLSLCFQEQLLLAFLIRLFTLYSLPLEKLKIRRIETQIINGKSETMIAVGMIPPTAMTAAAPPTSLDKSEIELLIKGWATITSSNPEVMETYLRLPPTTRFQEGLKDFRTRLPSPKTGLNRCQTELLEAYPLDQPSINAHYLIGTVMGKLFEARHRDVMNDLYVQWLLMQMTNLDAPQPAFIISDPYTRVHCVSITDFGRALLEGKANWMDENLVDYYVGGVHVKNTLP